MSFSSPISFEVERHSSRSNIIHYWISMIDGICLLIRLLYLFFSPFLLMSGLLFLFWIKICGCLCFIWLYPIIVIMLLNYIHADNWFLHCCNLICSDATSTGLGSWSTHATDGNSCGNQFENAIAIFSPCHRPNFSLFVPVLFDVPTISSIC